MYFKVIPGCALYDTLMDIHEQIKFSSKACKELQEEVGSDGYSLSYSSYLAGDINAFHFSSCRAPYPSWKCLQGCFYMPMTSKKYAKDNADILAKLAAIPRVKKDLLKDAVKCGNQGYSHAGGLAFFTAPSVIWKSDVVLLEFPDKVNYTPVEGMTEILASEFKSLSEKETLDYDEN